MTIIVWDGKYVAADGLAVTKSLIASTNYKKIHVLDDVAYAFCGSWRALEPMLEWVHKFDADMEKRPPFSEEDKNGDTSLIKFTRGGLCYRYWCDCPYPDPEEAPWAWGADKELAIGALRAGATAMQAAQIVMDNSVWSGGKLQVVRLSDLKDLAE